MGWGIYVDGPLVMGHLNRVGGFTDELKHARAQLYMDMVGSYMYQVVSRVFTLVQLL